MKILIIQVSLSHNTKSYVFDMKDIYGEKICIIDRPGFDDTRGLHQDDLNIQHILEYVNNLMYLNVIRVCYLLRLNTSGVSNSFCNTSQLTTRSCGSQRKAQRCVLLY